MRALKGLVCFTALAFMLLVLAFAWGRLRGPSATQAKALELFDQNMRPATGRNAFPAQWLGNYDVPADQIDAVYAQDRQRVQQWLVQWQSMGKAPADFIVPSGGKYPKLQPFTAEDNAITCGDRDGDCLDTVRAHREALRALVARQTVRLRHDQELAQYDFEWNDLPPSALTPYPPYFSSQNLWLSSAALDFVDGKSIVGLRQACADVSALRRLHAHANTLVGTMVAAGRMRGAARVVVRMLSELPPGQNLPVSCFEAFAAVSVQDVDLRESMQWEFRSSQDTYKKMGESQIPRDWQKELAFSRTGMQRQQAAQFAWMGSDSVHRQMLDDRRFTEKDFPNQVDIFDWLSNFSGSVLNRMVQPAYVDYLNRQEDTAATLRLVATAIWLRQTRNSEKSIEQRLQQRPAWMQVANDRGLHLSVDGRSLHMGYYGPGKTTPTEWPLSADR